MSDIRYTEDHEWLRPEEDGSVTIGITDYAQEQLGDVVYVELPEVGTDVDAGEQLAVVESVKAVGEIKMPVGGAVAAVNERLADEPELVNGEPLDGGWLARIEPSDAGALEAFMDEDAYNAYVAEL